VQCVPRREPGNEGIQSRFGQFVRAEGALGKRDADPDQSTVDAVFEDLADRAIV